MAEGITMETRQFPAAELVITFKSSNRKLMQESGHQLRNEDKSLPRDGGMGLAKVWKHTMWLTPVSTLEAETGGFGSLGRMELSIGSHLWKERFAKMDMKRQPEANYIEVSESRILNFIIKENYLILSSSQIWETGWHILTLLAVLYCMFPWPAINHPLPADTKQHGFFPTYQAHMKTKQ